MGVCNCSMFCCTLFHVHSSIAIILMGKRELIALLNLSSWCLVMVDRLFLALPRGCLQFVIVVFPDHTHLLFFICLSEWCRKMIIISERVSEISLTNGGIRSAIYDGAILLLTLCINNFAGVFLLICKSNHIRFII